MKAPNPQNIAHATACQEEGDRPGGLPHSDTHWPRQTWPLMYLDPES